MRARAYQIKSILLSPVILSICLPFTADVSMNGLLKVSIQCASCSCCNVLRPELTSVSSQSRVTANIPLPLIEKLSVDVAMYNRRLAVSRAQLLHGER